MKYAIRLCSRLGLTLLLGGGCAHGPSTGPANGIYSGPPRLVSADDRGEAMPVPAGQPLRSGQVFALDLELQYPAHVYVVHHRGGLLGSLYPGVGIADKELSRGVVRIPGPDAWMRVPPLDRQTHLCILLSAQPLDARAQLRHCPQGREKHLGRELVVQSFALTPVR